MKSNIGTGAVIGFTLTAIATMAVAPLSRAATATYTTADLASRMRHVIDRGNLTEVDDALEPGDASAEVFHIRHLPAAPSRCSSSKNWGMARFSCSQPNRGEDTPRSGDNTPPSGDTTRPSGNNTPRSGDNTPPSGDNTPPFGVTLGGGVTYEYTPQNNSDDPPPHQNSGSPQDSPGESDPDDPPHGGIQPTPEPSYFLVTGPALLILAGLAYRRRRHAAAQI